MKSFRLVGSILISLTSLAFCNAQSFAQTSFQNSIAVDVGKNPDDQTNYPLVTVQICVPGTKTCQMIPNIFLDTGSTGLRLKVTGINPEILAALPIEKDSVSKLEVAECYEYADSDDWWGRVGKADLRFGDELAANMSVQLVDPSYKKVPKDCGGNSKGVANEKINGVLGVNFVRTDCYEKDCVGDAQSTDHFAVAYYTCDDQSVCSPHTMATADQLANPIYAFGKDANGYILHLPKTGSQGSMDSAGTMTFGIGTRENNSVNPKASVVTLDDTDNNFPVTINGIKMTGFFDSGTSSYALPAKLLNIPVCRHDKNQYLCPKSLMQYEVDFEDIHNQASNFQISIVDAEELLKTNRFAFDNIATDKFPDYPDQLFLALPFFFGRTLYFGFSGENSAFGAGKHVAVISDEN